MCWKTTKRKTSILRSSRQSPLIGKDHACHGLMNWISHLPKLSAYQCSWIPPRSVLGITMPQSLSAVTLIDLTTKTMTSSLQKKLFYIQTSIPYFGEKAHQHYLTPSWSCHMALFYLRHCQLPRSILDLAIPSWTISRLAGHVHAGLPLWYLFSPSSVQKEDTFFGRFFRPAGYTPVGPATQ